MNLGLFNQLVYAIKKNDFVNSFIKELSDYIVDSDRKEKNNMCNDDDYILESDLKQENTLYQVVDKTEDSVFLQNTKTNTILEEKNIEKNLLDVLQSDFIVRYEDGKYILEKELTDKFFDSLIDISEFKKIQEKFINETDILKLNPNTEFKVKLHDEDYSVLEYNGKTINVPNVLLPFFIDEESVLQFDDGKFNILN